MKIRYPAMMLSLMWPAMANAEAWPAPIQTLEAQGLTIHERFDAPGGLSGYAASAQGREVAVYLTQDGEHAIVGTLIDAEGNNLSAAPLNEIVRGPQDTALWDALADTAWIADGPESAERIIYTFTDPNCPYCKQFWEQARPWVDAGRVQLRHIMVGILKHDSPLKAISLLAAEDPAEALEAHQQGQEVRLLETLPREFEEALVDNHQQMEALGLGATPSTLYHDDQGRLSVAQGVPPEEKLEQVMGSPKP